LRRAISLARRAASTTGSADADDRVWGSRLTYPNLGEVRETGQQVGPGTHVVYVDSDSIGQRLASRPKPMLERG